MPITGPQTGQHTRTVRATDSQGGTTERTFTIWVVDKPEDLTASTLYLPIVVR